MSPYTTNPGGGYLSKAWGAIVQFVGTTAFKVGSVTIMTAALTSLVVTVAFTAKEGATIGYVTDGAPEFWDAALLADGKPAGCTVDGGPCWDAGAPVYAARTVKPSTAIRVGDLTIAKGIVASTGNTTIAVLNTIATTVNAFGAAATLTLGDGSGASPAIGLSGGVLTLDTAGGVVLKHNGTTAWTCADGADCTGAGNVGTTNGDLSCTVASGTANVTATYTGGAQVQMQAANIGGYLGTSSNHPFCFFSNGSTRICLAADGSTFGSNTTSLVSAGGSTGKAMCWKSTGAMGYCSSVVAADGSCTCN